MKKIINNKWQFLDSTLKRILKHKWTRRALAIGIVLCSVTATVIVMYEYFLK